MKFFLASVSETLSVSRCMRGEMSYGLLLHAIVGLTVLSGLTECCVPRHLHVKVPGSVTGGDVVAQVHGCDSQIWYLNSSDPDFVVQKDGMIVAMNSISFQDSGRVFSVWAWMQGGDTATMEVNLEGPSSAVLKRSKRRWRPLPFSITENDKPPFPKSIDFISSDSSADYNVYYVIDGPGVTEDPVGVFSVDSNTGLLMVHKAVDREQYPQITFSGRAFDKRTNIETDLPLTIIVEVIDLNDNKPTFVGPLKFFVDEQSAAGTEVGQVIAEDRDDPNTDHTKIAYVMDGQNKFIIQGQTGIIKTIDGSLDREMKSTYLLPVEIRDLRGGVGYLSNSATATIVVKDINDNPPTFTESSFTATVMENKVDHLLLRLPVKDADEKNTPNWNAVYAITKGNEKGNFRVDTDPTTNEGLLYVVKALDHESTKQLNLEVEAKNPVPLVGTAASWNKVPVTVTVTNVDEGPQFNPENLFLVVKENTPNGTIIGKYIASDPETTSSASIRYSEILEPASWIDFGATNGELKVVNTIDKESSFVKNGLYNMTVKAVDSNSKTGTGTIVIKIEDENDNIPSMASKDLVVCDMGNELGSVPIRATDKDAAPFSAPFSFHLDESIDNKWTLKTINGTSAMLRPAQDMPRGIYSVPVLVQDLQGMGETQTLKVQICECRQGACVTPKNSIAFGKFGILTMLLGPALLLLLTLLALLACGNTQERLKLEETYDNGGMLLKSNTEGPGEDSAVPSAPFSEPDSMKGSMIRINTLNTNATGTWPTKQQPPDIMVTDMQDMYSSQQGGGVVVDGYDNGTIGYNSGTIGYNNGTMGYNNMSPNTWNTNAVVINQKLGYMSSEEEGRFADDIMLPYGYEGVGSAAGSVGCCSDIGPQDNMEFINSLGPKFRTLAEACTKKQTLMN